MPRAWLLALVILLTRLGVAATNVSAQNVQNGNTRQYENLRARQVDPASYSVDPASASDVKTGGKITPSKRAGTGEKTNSDAAKSSATGSLWTSFGSLAIVIVIILLGARTWKKHGPRIGGGIPTEAVEVLGKRVIDQKQCLHLVRLGSRILLLGSSPGGLRTLAEVTDPVDVDYLAGLCKQSDADGAAASFRSLFNRSATARTTQRSRSRAGEIPLQSRAESSEPQRFPHPDLEEAHG